MFNRLYLYDVPSVFVLFFVTIVLIVFTLPAPKPYKHTFPGVRVDVLDFRLRLSRTFRAD